MASGNSQFDPLQWSLDYQSRPRYEIGSPANFFATRADQDRLYQVARGMTTPGMTDPYISNLQRQNVIGGMQMPQDILDTIRGILPQISNLANTVSSMATTPAATGPSTSGFDVDALLAPLVRMQENQRLDAQKAFTGSGRDITSTALQERILPQIAATQAEQLGAEATKAGMAKEATDVERFKAEQMAKLGNLQNMMQTIQQLMGFMNPLWGMLSGGK